MLLKFGEPCDCPRFRLANEIVRDLINIIRSVKGPGLDAILLNLTTRINLKVIFDLDIYCYK